MYNKAIVVGRLTADPELRQTQNGHSVTSFTLAVDRPYQSGREKEVDFLNIVAWRGTAEFVCKWFSKGNPMLVDGSIQTRRYTDKQGVERNVWEIVADQVRFVESRRAGSDYSSPEPTGTFNAAPQEATGTAADFAEIEDSDDLPF